MNFAFYRITRITRRQPSSSVCAQRVLEVTVHVALLLSMASVLWIVANIIGRLMVLPYHSGIA